MSSSDRSLYFQSQIPLEARTTTTIDKLDELKKNARFTKDLAKKKLIDEIVNPIGQAGMLKGAYGSSRGFKGLRAKLNTKISKGAKSLWKKVRKPKVDSEGNVVEDDDDVDVIGDLLDGEGENISADVQAGADITTTISNAATRITEKAVGKLGDALSSRVDSAVQSVVGEGGDASDGIRSVISTIGNYTEGAGGLSDVVDRAESLVSQEGAEASKVSERVLTADDLMSTEFNTNTSQGARGIQSLFSEGGLFGKTRSTGSELLNESLDSGERALESRGSFVDVLGAGKRALSRLVSRGIAQPTAMIQAGRGGRVPQPSDFHEGRGAVDVGGEGEGVSASSESVPATIEEQVSANEGLLDSIRDGGIDVGRTAPRVYDASDRFVSQITSSAKPGGGLSQFERTETRNPLQGNLQEETALQRQARLLEPPRTSGDVPDVPKPEGSIDDIKGLSTIEKTLPSEGQDLAEAGAEGLSALAEEGVGAGVVEGVIEGGAVVDAVAPELSVISLGVDAITLLGGIALSVWRGSAKEPTEQAPDQITTTNIRSVATGYGIE